MATPALTARRVRGRTLLLAIAALIVVLVGVTVFLPTVIFPPSRPKLDDHGQLPAFALTDHTGATMTRDSLEGHVTIVNFIFTRCDTVCPITSGKMRTIQDRTGDAPDIKLVTLSIDPAYDTVPRLAAYAARYGADPTRWRFATGEPTVLREVIEHGFEVGYDDLGGTTASGAPNFTHSGHFVLLDQDAHVRGFYDSNDWPRVEKLMKDARYLDHHPPRG